MNSIRLWTERESKDFTIIFMDLHRERERESRGERQTEREEGTNWVRMERKGWWRCLSSSAVTWMFIQVFLSFGILLCHRLLTHSLFFFPPFSPSLSLSFAKTVILLPLSFPDKNIYLRQSLLTLNFLLPSSSTLTSFWWLSTFFHLQINALWFYQHTMN